MVRSACLMREGHNKFPIVSSRAAQCHHEKIRKRGSAASLLQASRRAHAEQFAHDQPEVPRRDLQQITFRHF